MDALILTAALALGFAPAGGGLYTGERAVKGSGGVVTRLELANDGGEFMEESTVWVTQRCLRGRAEDEVRLDLGPGTSVFPYRVTRAGTFRAREGAIRLRGRFGASGRRLFLRVRAAPLRRGCRRLSTTVTARLERRPHRTRPGGNACEHVHVGRLASVDVTEQGAGCTRARRIGHAWRRAASCRDGAAWRACTVMGRRCEPLEGGALDPLAAVRCGAPDGSAVEVAPVRDCGERFGDAAGAINLTCAEAEQRFPLGPLDDACEIGPGCRAGGWTCEAGPRPGAHGLRCSDDARPHTGVIIYEPSGIV